MSEVELRRLMRRAQAGSNDALNTLVIQLTDMVERVAHGFYFPGAGRDDVIQSGMIGLLSGIRSCDLGVGGEVEGFLAMCVRRQIITDVKFHQRLKHAPLNHAYGLGSRVPSDPIHTFEEVLVGGEDPAALVERQQRFRRLVGMVAGLTELERRSVVGIADGDSYQQITADTGYTEKQIDNSSQRARRKLRLLEAA